MPKIAVYKFLTFFIVTYDAFNEPPHLHISNTKGYGKRSAKIWIETGQFAETGDLTDKEQNLVRKLVFDNKKALLISWKKTRDGQKVKTINLYDK